MTRRLLPALALSVFVALPSTALAGQAPLHPAPGDAPASFKGIPGAVAKKKSSKKKRKADRKAPAIKKISPRSAKVGEVLVVTGKNFRKGKRKNRVYFYTRKGGAVLTRDEAASSKRLRVRIPAKLAALLPANGDKTRIMLRIRGKRLGKRSATRVSPLIAIDPNMVGGDDGPGSGDPTGCNPQPGDPLSDVDKDLIPDGRERDLTMNACSRDSDGDGASDGYEYHSAIDLNSNALPYPWKRPYPNALFKDSDVDYDGDGLTVWDEYSLWTKYGNSSLPLNYSDGNQRTVPTAAPVAPSLAYLDIDGNGVLSDDERDADGDNLGNWDEVHGRMTPDWWKAMYDGSNGPLETPYPVTFAATNMLDPDSDGDTVPDGADDQDFDGLRNGFEVDRPWDWALTYISLGHNWNGAPVDPDPVTAGNQARYYSRVQPFNPCKPVFSARCHIHPPFGHYAEDEDWMAPRTPAPPAPGVMPGDV